MLGRIVAALPIGAIVFKLTKMLNYARSFHAMHSDGLDVQLKFYTLKGGWSVYGWSSSVALVFFLPLQRRF